MVSRANDNSPEDRASDAKSTLTPSTTLPQRDAILDSASDATSTLTPSIRPAHDPTIQLQPSDRSPQSKFTIREFYNEGQGWGEYNGDLDAEGRRCGNGLLRQLLSSSF